MSGKIPLNKIAELTAAESGEELSVTVQFIKDLFSIIEDEVSNGKEVKVEGLGVFSKSSAANEPISFVADDLYAARLNEAFAMFSEVELHDEVTDKDLDEANLDETNTGNEPAEAQPEIEEESKGSDTDAEVKEVETIVSIPDLETKQPENEEQEEDSLTVTETVDAENSVSLPEIEATGKEVTDTDEVPTDDAIETVDDSGIEEDDVEYVIVKKSKSRFFIGFIIGLLLGFAAGVIAFLAYIVRVLQVQVEDVFPF